MRLPDASALPELEDRRSNRQKTNPIGTIPTGTTPVPNILFDTFLPRLSDTELRVLLVVDRATLGWKEGAGRKASDWLSHRQLQARTGRAGASVSRAVESLVCRGLLVVQDGSGQVRDSAHSRRAARGRLYYRLGDALLSPAQNSGRGSESPISEAPKSGQTSSGSTSTTRLQKLKTTKETGTKENQKQDVEMLSFKSEVHALRTLSRQNLTETKPGETGQHSPSQALPQKEIPAAELSEEDDLEVRNELQESELQEQVERFEEMFVGAYRLARPGDPLPPVEAADRLLLRKYLRFPGPGTLEAWLIPFFDASFGYARRRSWSLE